MTATAASSRPTAARPVLLPRWFPYLLTFQEIPQNDRRRHRIHTRGFLVSFRLRCRGCFLRLPTAQPLVHHLHWQPQFFLDPRRKPRGLLGHFTCAPI